jgi:hypothetical protein
MPEPPRQDREQQGHAVGDLRGLGVRLGLPPDDAQHRRVLAVLAYLRA